MYIDIKTIVFLLSFVLLTILSCKKGGETAPENNWPVPKVKTQQSDDGSITNYFYDSEGRITKYDEQGRIVKQDISTDNATGSGSAIFTYY